MPRHTVRNRGLLATLVLVESEGDGSVISLIALSTTSACRQVTPRLTHFRELKDWRRSREWGRTAKIGIRRENEQIRERRTNNVLG